jgi:alpha-beta hydrolase superfamily lysophospholipase
MVRKGLRWVWTHRKLTLGLCLLLTFLGLNLIAYMHAYAMTHFVRGGERTSKPESLSVWNKAKVLFTGVNIPRPANRATPEHAGLPFTVHHLAADGQVDLEAWHIDHPQAKRLVVMFHGYAGCKDDLLPAAQAFHDLGYATFLVDFRGSGGSGGDVTTIGVAEADDVVRAWDYVRAHWPGSAPVLFGTSMGSAAILRAVATTGIEPTALVLECPFDRLLSTVSRRCDAMHVPRFPCAHLLVFWGGVQHGFNGFAHNPVRYAESVHCPVLLLHGDCDIRVTPAEAQSIYANLGGAKHLEIFEGVGHEGYVEARPEQWRSRVSWFLSAIPAR